MQYYRMCVGRPRTLTIEERNENAKLSRSNWRAKLWNCVDCGKEMKNSARCYHYRTCEFTNKPYTSEEQEKRIQNIKQWNDKAFECDKCGKSMKNQSKSHHMKTCGRNHTFDQLTRLEEIRDEFIGGNFSSGAEFTTIVGKLHSKHFITNQQRDDLINLLQTL